MKYLLDVNLLICAVWDTYLADLAAKHGMLLATLDEGIQHKAAFLVPA